MAYDWFQFHAHATFRTAACRAARCVQKKRRFAKGAWRHIQSTAWKRTALWDASLPLPYHNLHVWYLRLATSPSPTKCLCRCWHNRSRQATRVPRAPHNTRIATGSSRILEQIALYLHLLEEHSWPRSQALATNSPHDYHEPILRMCKTHIAWGSANLATSAVWYEKECQPVRPCQAD